MSMFVRGFLRFVIATATALTFCAASYAGVWYVDKSNASGAEDGTSWARAFSTIQPAIDAAHQDGGGEVWIAAGVYDENRVFLDEELGETSGQLWMREDVALYGGFSGSETKRTQRNVLRHETVIDGSKANAGDATPLVVVGASNTVLDGLVITGGNSDYWSGLRNQNVESVLISNCVFRDNFGITMWNGGASNVTIDKCLFKDNSGEVGAAVALANYQSTVDVFDTAFEGNVTVNASGPVVWNHSSQVRYWRCSFRENEGTAIDSGGTINEWIQRIEIIDCDFFGNVGDSFASAISHDISGEDLVLEGSTFIGHGEQDPVTVYGWPTDPKSLNIDITNCAFVNNDSTPLRLSGANFHIKNCVFTGNLFCACNDIIVNASKWEDPEYQIDVSVSNSILWNEQSVNEFGWDDPEKIPVLIENSIVRGGYDGEGIIDERPSFRNQPDGDFRLLPHSVGVGIADVATALDLDLFGTPRPQGPGFDMGAHEVRVVNPTLCEASPEIEAALGRLRFVAELYGDLDDDGLPEIASLRLLETAACVYDTSKGFAAERAFELNLNAVDNEPFDMRILRKRDLIAALVAVGEETQRTVRDAFAEEGVVLLESYAVVACDETGACETLIIDPAVRGAVPITMDEPFPGPGDYDLDGLTNSQEWAGVISQGGGLDDFVLAATDPSIRATVASASGGGCFIATAAYGTPLAGEIDVLRILRDRRLLTNAFGAAFTDTYYRLSPPLADIVAGNHALRAAVRTSLGAGLWIFEFVTTLQAWILVFGFAMILAPTLLSRLRSN